MNACGRFFGNAQDRLADCGVETGLFLQVPLHHTVKRFFFFIGRVIENGRVLFGLRSQHAEQGRVAAVVENEVGVAAIGPFEDLVGVIPVLDQVLALEGEDRRALGGDGCGSVVLRREDVARRPANICAQGLKRFDQHRGLDGHVQRAGDPCAFQHLRWPVLGARRHETRHFGLGDIDLFPAVIGEADVLDDVVGHGGAPVGVSDEPGFYRQKSKGAITI